MRVLLLSPHTDDVEIGAGGLIARLQATGEHEFRWFVFSRCADSLPAELSPEILECEFRGAAQVLGVEDIHVFDYEVRTMPGHRQEILEVLVRSRREFNPDLVLAPCLEDVHQDHMAVAQESLRAFKNSSTILGYEQPWNTVEFAARVLVRLSAADIQRKWEALSHYTSQTMLGRPYMERDAVFSWARARGNQCGSEYAEAFDLPRGVI